ncbi:MAG: DEAD/DEAH box helicase [Anaerolineae bacterium]|nr:DEAD/DEAH box helicase [Anaerolineae bacterium]MBT7075793.1 DEAD/DEAH box helicase [Anaerolineae bacterium]MBT7781743.1 DEAD/DEAH box helicase [Anaerolineae bacterium]
MNFNQFNLDSRLNTGIKNAGYEIPTPIQEKAIPAVLAGQDLIGTAQTGTGKTAAFVLPILHKLLKGPRKQTRALIITPTRELAEQIHQTVRSLSAGTGLRSATVYGGVGAQPQIQAFQRGVEVIVACPGRLLDLHSKGQARLNRVEILVLDEADRMFDMGFLPDVRRIIKAVPTQRQTLLFSATFQKEVERLANQTLKKPQRVSIGMIKPVHTVSHALYPVPQHLKRVVVLELLKKTDTESVLIFTRTKHRARRLEAQLGKAGYSVTSLHSNRTQGQRQRALKGFKSGQFQIMVATDIAARGLDIETISHVINFDMPDTEDAYIHRIGRTGRAKRSGEAFTLSTPDDEPMIRRLEKIMKQTLVRRWLDDVNYDAPAPKYSPRPPRQKRKPQQSGGRNQHKSKTSHRQHRSRKGS